MAGNHVYADDGVYTVTVTVDDTTSTDGDSDTFTVTVDNVAPAVGAGSDHGVEKEHVVVLLVDPG